MVLIMRTAIIAYIWACVVWSAGFQETSSDHFSPRPGVFFHIEKIEIKPTHVKRQFSDGQWCWVDYVETQLRKLHEYRETPPITKSIGNDLYDALTAFKEMLQNMVTNKSCSWGDKINLWVAYATHQEVPSCTDQRFDHATVDMAMTVIVDDELPFISFMGIHRSLNNFMSADPY